MTAAYDPRAGGLNFLQRAWFARMLPRYRQLDDETFRLVCERDRFLLGTKSLGLWCGMVCGITGTAYGLSSSGLTVWLSLLSSALIFAAFFKSGVRAWVQPKRFSGRRLWAIAFTACIATYAGAISSFGSRLQAMIGDGVPWYQAVARIAWRATPLQIMVLIGALLMLAAISTARREYLQRALDQSRAEQERDAAARQLTQARLSLLQAQIQPHFLFNTLAALQHWVDVGDARAAPLLRALTSFLRGSTELMLRDDVTLAQECEMVDHYLAIMQARLGARLRFSIDLAEDCAEQRLPPGLVITLVENAVQHGIEPSLRGGEVKVVARHVIELDAPRVFELLVQDDGVGLQAAAPPATGPAAAADGGASAEPGSIGLANSRERLRHLFGDRADLRLQARAGGPGTEVRLRVAPEPEQSARGQLEFVQTADRPAVADEKAKSFWSCFTRPNA